MTDTTKHRILLVDDDPDGRTAMQEWLERRGYDAVAVGDGEEALQRIYDGVEVIVTDLKMPKIDGLELLRAVNEKSPHAAVILVSGHGTVDTAVQALKDGAFDFLSKPVNLQELTHRIEMALEKQAMAAEIAKLHRQLLERTSVDDMVGRSTAIRELLEKIRLVANTNSTVLIIGESGTGKELVARSLHFSSRRAEKPFVPVNCAAIPDALIESELFGHEKGAFTGATERRIGLFEAADGGTLFIDEIGELDMGLQSKLLRAIESKRVMRVGGTQETPVDVRLVAATNRDLGQRVKDGQFREDLYYRLKVVVLPLPPLRERRDDIPLLTRFFVDQIARENDRPVQGVTPDALQRLLDYDWPGNVRELRNTLEGIIVLSMKDEITLNDLPEHLRPPEQVAEPPPVVTGKTIADLEQVAIRQALIRHGGHRAETAKELGLSVRTLQRKIKEYDLTERES